MEQEEWRSCKVQERGGVGGVTSLPCMGSDTPEDTMRESLCIRGSCDAFPAPLNSTSLDPCASCEDGEITVSFWLDKLPL